MNDVIFKPIPAALIERMRDHVSALESAVDPHAQRAAIFLLHCECQDAMRKVEQADQEQTHP